MKLKMIIEIEVETSNLVNTEQAKGVLLSVFNDIKNDTERGQFKGEFGEAIVNRITLDGMYKNGFEI